MSIPKDPNAPKGMSLHTCINPDCQAEFYGPVMRVYCYTNPECEQLRQDAKRAASRKAQIKWVEKHPKYYLKRNEQYKTKQEKKDRPRCEICGRLITNGNEHWCGTCHTKLTDGLPDSVNTYY
jgi:hypothetical protein